MRKYLGAAAIAAVAALFMAAPAFAASNAVLSDGAANPNGTNTAVGAVITSGLLSGTNATFFTTATGTTGITCSISSTSATVQSNPVAPGEATLSLTKQDFSSCTSNITGVRSVNSVTTKNLAYTVKIDSPGVNGCQPNPPNTHDCVTILPGSNGGIDAVANVTNIFNQTFNCSYHVHDASGNLFGTASNASNDIKITNQQLDGDAGNNGQCVSTVFFSADYGPQTDTSVNPNASVFTN